VTPDEQRLAAQAALYDEVLDTQITTHVVDFLVRTQMLLRIAHAASGAKAGFRIYVVASRGGGGRSGPRPRGMEEFL